MLILIIKGFLGGVFFLSIYGIIGNVLNFPIFYLWYKRRTPLLNNISYLFLLFYSLIFYYFLGVYFATFSEALKLYSNNFASIIIPLVIVLIMSGHLLKQNYKMKELVIEAENNYKVRFRLLDEFEYKMKQYLMVITKFGSWLYVIYILLALFHDYLSTISFGLSEYLIKHFLN